MHTDQIAQGFQTPRHVASPADCYFYHSIELPGLGLQVGHWDLRNDIEAYLGHQSFAGRTVADVGTASGYVTFELEKRGATVISFDRVLEDRSDDVGLIPFDNYESKFGLTWDAAIEHRLDNQRRLQNSYWLAHRLLESKARLYCGNVYDGMPDVESVDVSFFGCILLHLRDPLGALTKFGRITKDTLIITDTLENLGGLGEYPIMFLRANAKDLTNSGTWWAPTPGLLKQFLEVLGFTRFTQTTHTTRHVLDPNPVKLYTIVAQR